MTLENWKLVRDVYYCCNNRIQIWLSNCVFSGHCSRTVTFSALISAKVAQYSPTPHAQNTSHTRTPRPQQDTSLLPRHEGERHHWWTGDSSLTSVSWGDTIPVWNKLLIYVYKWLFWLMGFFFLWCLDAKEEEDAPQLQPSSGGPHRLGDGLPWTPASLSLH